MPRPDLLLLPALLHVLPAQATGVHVLTGAQELPGAAGEVLEAIETEGRARVHGEPWQVKSRVPLAPGDGGDEP